MIIVEKCGAKNLWNEYLMRTYLFISLQDPPEELYKKKKTLKKRQLKRALSTDRFHQEYCFGQGSAREGNLKKIYSFIQRE